MCFAGSDEGMVCEHSWVRARVSRPVVRSPDLLALGFNIYHAVPPEGSGAGFSAGSSLALCFSSRHLLRLSVSADRTSGTSHPVSVSKPRDCALDLLFGSRRSSA